MDSHQVENLKSEKATQNSVTGRKRIILIWIEILAFVTYVAINLGLVFAHGVCCGDDSYYAHIAKNLADGIGFVSTMPLGQVHFSITPFDPLLGTGPTIILPAAFVINLVGNTYWAPGLTQVLIWSALLLCIGIILHKISSNQVGITVATIVFFFFSYTYMAYHLEQWYALLGEIPASLLIILAILIYYLHQTKLYLFITGCFFSLAVQTKFISLIPFGVFLVFIIINNFFQNRKVGQPLFRSITRMLFYILLGFLIPIALFELWKFMTIGAANYLSWWTKYIGYIFGLGLKVDLSLAARLLERINIARQRFGIFLPAIFVIFAVIGLSIKKEKKLFSLFICCVSIVSILTIYWLLLGLGWARYYIISLVIVIFCLSIPYIYWKPKKRHLWIYSIILIGLTVYNIKNINIGYPLKNVELFTPTENTLALQEVSQYLSDWIEYRPFYTEGWSNAADIEYIMDSNLNFSTIYDPDLDNTKPIIIVNNMRLLFTKSEKLTDILSKCNQKNIAVYSFALCPPLNSQ